MQGDCWEAHYQDIIRYHNRAQNSKNEVQSLLAIKNKKLGRQFTTFSRNLIRHNFQLQSWPKCVGQSAFFPHCCNIRSLPLPPRCNVGRLVGKPFLTNNIAWGEGEEGRIWPKERLFPCEKLIDGRGSAFCKLVPHNFGQDCSHQFGIYLKTGRHSTHFGRIGNCISHHFEPCKIMYVM